MPKKQAKCVQCPVDTYRGQEDDILQCKQCPDGENTNNQVGQPKCTKCVNATDCKCDQENEYYDDITGCTSCDTNKCPIGSSRVGCFGASKGRCETWEKAKICKLDGAIDGASGTKGGSAFRIHAYYIGKDGNKEIEYIYGEKENIELYHKNSVAYDKNIIFKTTACIVIKGHEDKNAGIEGELKCDDKNAGIIQCETGEGVGINLVGFLQIGEDWSQANASITNDTSAKINAVQKSEIFDSMKMSYEPPVITRFDGNGAGVGNEGASTFGNEIINIYGEDFGMFPFIFRYHPYR